MPIKHQKRPASKLYQQDIVQCIAPPHAFGVVLRCWHDAEDVPIPENLALGDPILRTLKHGEVGVSFVVDQHHHREVLQESELHLIDRTLSPGDYCKRSIDDVKSGVVTNVRVRGRLTHVINGQPLSDWKSVEDLEAKQKAEVGDYVTYDDWIGQVLEVFDESLIELQYNGRIVRLPELSSRLNVGERGTDILPPPGFPNLTSMIGSVFGNRMSLDTVLDVTHTVYAISWLAINQSLDPEDAAQRKRPQRFWSGQDIGNLTLIRGRSDMEMRTGDRVHLKEKNLPVTVHGSEGISPGLWTVATYVVTMTETTVDVLWQDGTNETVLARDLLPYLNPDEYDCWPGDYVMWKSEEGQKAAIVQTVDATERTATVLFPESGTKEMVSLLELDPHGNSDPAYELPNAPADIFGVRRGDFVFIHRPGTTNGYAMPRVPRIGELEAWVRETPFEEGQICGWRKEMSTLGYMLSDQADREIVNMKLPSSGDESTLWIGEVTGLNLDGTVEVTHPDCTVKTYPLERLTRLYDGIEQLEEEMFEQEGSEGDAMSETQEMWAMEEDGIWRYDKGSDHDDWVDEEVDMDEDLEDESDDVGPTMNGNGAADLDSMDLDVTGWGDSGPSPPLISPATPPSTTDQLWNQLAAEAAVNNNIPTDPSEHSTHRVYSPASTTSSLPGSSKPFNSLHILPGLTTATSTSLVSAHSGPSSLSKEYVFKDQVKDSASDMEKVETSEELSWKRFDILPSAPVDHAFYSSPPAQPAKSFLSRLNKEYRALANSLPDTIIVRAFEDRTDLLRSLIIGPENTPYEDAPFVIDWMLDSNFPNSPPIAHFLSWTNGNGRVNPNLYEEGKVCLSILGTWAGDRNETWSASRSSLLQAFVSIQGLVLVKEPWFCEPAYEKLRGTEEGIVNSRLYSEKAYVLSRGFVRRALEIPLGGLEEEINWLYHTHGRLRKVLSDSRRLIESSKHKPKSTPSSSLTTNKVEGDEKEEVEVYSYHHLRGGDSAAIPRLTGGGIITLERTLTKLQALLDVHESKVGFEVEGG